MSARWSGDEWPAGQEPLGSVKIERVRYSRRDKTCRQGGPPRPYLSVVAPAHNEANNLPLLVEETVHALRRISIEWGSPRFEIIIVDDASTDRTRQVLEHLAGVHPELRFFTIARRGGQSAALFAGIRGARGKWIATLDADLQNDPADLARLWAALPGHDAALGYRRARADVWSKKVIAFWANRIRNRVLGQEIRDTGCSLRIFRRRMGLRLPNFSGAHRFIGPLLLREGCDIVQVSVGHRPRRHGQSHYGLRNRSLGVVLDLMGVAWLMKRSLQCEFSRVDQGQAKSRQAALHGNGGDERVAGWIEG